MANNNIDYWPTSQNCLIQKCIILMYWKLRFIFLVLRFHNDPTPFVQSIHQFSLIITSFLTRCLTSSEFKINIKLVCCSTSHVSIKYDWSSYSIASSLLHTGNTEWETFCDHYLIRNLFTSAPHIVFFVLS